MSFMVKLIPSPDWFVGVASFTYVSAIDVRSILNLIYIHWTLIPIVGLTFTSKNSPSNPRQPVYMLSPRRPIHTASEFYYRNMTSLPAKANVYLTKLPEYRRKGKTPPAIKRERNMIIFDSIDTSKVIPKLEKIIDRTITQNKEQRRNEIVAQITESQIDKEFARK